jgi:hypothetical protein
MGACHNLFFCPNAQIHLIWNRFGTGLGRHCVHKSRHYFLPKLVPNPFFGKNSYDFGKYRLKVMACRALE